MGCFGSRVAFLRSCAFPASTSRQNSRRQNTFAVQNVDDTGQGVSPGKLEVTETDLVLHVKGKPSLTWPLRCLRRYGYDNDLFSFESGRRCPTGAGIFAFRCHRAQSLFNLLQAKIQGNPGSLPALPTTPITLPITAGTPVNNQTAASTPASSTFVYVNLSESSSSRILTNTSGFPSGGTSLDATVQINKESGSGSNSNTGGHCLINLKPSSIGENHPVYMNVESHGGSLFAAGNQSSSSSSYPTAPRRNEAPIAAGSSFSPTATATASSSTSPVTNLNLGPHPFSECALYSNVFCSHNKQSTVEASNHAQTSGGLSTPHQRCSTGLPPIMQEPAEINYAELDLKTDRPSSSSSNNSPFFSRHGILNRHPELGATSSSGSAKLDTRMTSTSNPATTTDCTPPKLSQSQLQNNGDLGYATIDFDKTAALSMITRSKITLGFEEDEKGSSSKKSRHSSTGL